ncbi:hypothetical protein EON83_17350 [bacterium]|nr:MAG: hypothetical protein EON83_17350 [bacterium]
MDFDEDIDEILSRNPTDARTLLKVISEITDAMYGVTDSKKLQEGVRLIHRLAEPAGALAIGHLIVPFIDECEQSQREQSSSS